MPAWFSSGSYWIFPEFLTRPRVSAGPCAHGRPAAPATIAKQHDRVAARDLVAPVRGRAALHHFRRPQGAADGPAQGADLPARRRRSRAVIRRAPWIGCWRRTASRRPVAGNRVELVTAGEDAYRQVLELIERGALDHPHHDLYPRPRRGQPGAGRMPDAPGRGGRGGPPADRRPGFLASQAAVPGPA